jgi:hypothetical protein
MSELCPDALTWTAEEDAVVRELYLTNGAAEVAKRLNRSMTAVYGRAARLGLKKNRLWTHEEEVELRSQWESGTSVRSIARLLDRKPGAVFERAKHLQLRRGCPEGFEYLKAAARRTGYDRKTLVRILRWAKVPMKRSLSRPTKGASYGFRIADSDLIDEAVESWLATESVRAAALRAGVNEDMLRRRLVAAGVRDEGRAFRGMWRVRAEDVERALGPQHRAAA